MSAEKINELKIRIFDLQEMLEGRHQFEAQFFGALAELLAIPEESRQDPQVYINAVIALKEQIPVEAASDAEVKAE
ncbi:tail fiber chaperone [Cronobacter phage S13]|jgi:hypothetical protein|uniref:Uncharacterized protein n=1 Tax=Cronobacter phage LPCS28 TaxID=2924885 RepID=A0AAE9K6G9_9CAUD|nr:tail fiber chaperone [Cronobacter phage S13]YP_010665751.1 tail fiber chaperone [Cronobacter phage LPCS28]AIA64967.1 hypothetical protein S13_168 [Cronobacter phage S13]UNY46940.1 hypothetical protein EHEKIMEA_00033 [Cronobacter phage LPCS28]